LTQAQRKSSSLMEAFSDVGTAARKELVAELLDCDESDVDAALASIGIERCGECGIWHAHSDCDIEHPDRPMDKHLPGLRQWSGHRTLTKAENRVLTTPDRRPAGGRTLE
jgi:hypothetical protein